MLWLKQIINITFLKSIKIKELQREGKKSQNIGEFMLGSQIKKGSTI